MDKPRSLILAIDDAAANLDVLGASLDKEYDLQIATSGEEGLRVAKSSIPDLILLDVMMPGMDGFETCRRLKADPELRHIPVVFLTALNEVASEEKGLSLGAADYISKPISVEIARLRIRNLIERERMRNPTGARREGLKLMVNQETSEVRRPGEAHGGAASRDLRTPLRVIKDFSDTLRRKGSTDPIGDRRMMLQQIGGSASTLASMINEILVGSGAMDAIQTGQATDVEAVARKVVGNKSRIYPETKVRVGKLPAVAVPPSVIERILEILVENAFQFSATRADAEVEVGFSSADGDSVFFVRDNGVGLAMSLAARIFGISRLTREEGTALRKAAGLALARHLVEQEGGHIWFESAPGKGATFFFTLGT